jgi:hypothetical protein
MGRNFTITYCGVVFIFCMGLFWLIPPTIKRSIIKKNHTKKVSGKFFNFNSCHKTSKVIKTERFYIIIIFFFLYF